MTFRLAVILHLIIPSVIFAVFCYTQLLSRGKVLKTMFISIISFTLLQSLNIYFVHNTLINYLITLVIETLICFYCYYDAYKKRIQAVIIFGVIQFLSFYLAEIPLSFLFSIRLQTTIIFDREFTIYALLLFDMWLLALSYYYVMQYSSKHLPIFKYSTLPICQMIFGYVLFLLSFDLSLSWFLFIMICVITIMIITNIVIYKNYQDINYNFIHRFELTRSKELQQQEIELKQFKEEFNQDIESMEMLLGHHLKEEAQQFIKNKYKKLKELNIGGYCDNRMVDLVLHNKVLDMRSKNIEEYIDVLINSEYNIEDVDLVTLLFNIIDNAIEACEELADHRYIHIRMFEKYNCLYIEVINTKNPYINHSDLKTTKEDTMNHGIGISIIKNIVKKYKGDVVFEDNKETFRVKLFLKNQ